MNETDRSVASTGKKIYAELQATIETAYPAQYIAIEPHSGEYYIAQTLGNAITKGKAKYPNRQFYTTRIGTPLHLPGQ